MLIERITDRFINNESQSVGAPNKSILGQYQKIKSVLLRLCYVSNHRFGFICPKFINV